MKSALCFCMLFILSIKNPCLAIDWAKKAGGVSEEIATNIAADKSGNVYVTGYFNGLANFGSTTLTSFGDTDIFITKLDVSGNFLWAKNIGGVGEDKVYSITADASGNCYVTGSFNGAATFGSTTLTSSGEADIFIAKLDPTGNLIWAKKAGGSSNDEGSGIAIDISGNIYVTGILIGSTNPTFGSLSLSLPNAGYFEIFITKLDASGNFLWVKSAGGSGGDLSNDIATDDLGNCYITGSFQGPSANFGSVTLFTGSGAPDAYFAKLDSSGNFIWAKSIGNSYYDEGKSISTDGAGNTYVAGTFQGTVYFDSIELRSAGPKTFITKIDSSSNFLWAKSPGPDDGLGLSLTTDYSGNCYITGSLSSVDAFGLTDLENSDVFVAKMDSSGNYIWARGLNDIHYIHGEYISIDTLGNGYLAGFFLDTTTLGSTTLVSTGDKDIFITKLSLDEKPTYVNETSNNYKVFPNPTTGHLYLEFEEIQKIIEVKIRDLTGRLIETKLTQNARQINLEIDALPGIYFLEISNEEGLRSLIKILKK